MTYRQPEPKPFFFIRAASAEEARGKSRAYVSHDTFTGRNGRLDLHVEVVSEYLFAGSGLYDMDNTGLPYYSFFRSQGRLCLPGASVKGAIRSVAEAISASPLDPRQIHSCKDNTSLCPTCRLFGTTGYRGRVSFSDSCPGAPVQPRLVKIADLYAPKGRASGRKFYQNKRYKPLLDKRPAPGQRFVEAVPKGAVFHCSLSFENLEDSELSLLLHAAGIPDRFSPKLGGAKPRCFGAVNMAPVRLRLRENFFESRTVETEDLKQFLDRIMQNRDLIVDDNLTVITRNCAGTLLDSCPTGLY